VQEGVEIEVLVDDVIYCSRELVEVANDSLRGISPQPPNALVYGTCSLLLNVFSVACRRVRKRIHVPGIWNVFSIECVLCLANDSLRGMSAREEEDHV
jgi:hypothetical protein